MSKNPLGVYVVLPINDSQISTRVCWSDANIKGVLLRTTWASVQTSQTAHDWSYFQTGMGLASQHNKQIMMSIDGSLGNAPAWLYTLGAKSFPLAGGGSTPAPWDPVVLDHWTKLVTAWATKYDSNQSLASVTMWEGGTAIEFFFATNTVEPDRATLDSLGGPSLLLSGAEGLYQTFGAFAATPAYLATGEAYPDGNATMTTLAQNLPAGWGGLQSNALSSSFPSGGTFPHTTLTIAQAELIGPPGYQLLAPIGNPRMGGATLAQVLSNGLSNGAKWVQIYPGDPATDPGESSIIAFNKAVGA